MNSSDIEKFPYTPSRAIANEVPMEHCLVAGALPAPNGAMDRDDSSMQRASWLEASRRRAWFLACFGGQRRGFSTRETVFYVERVDIEGYIESGNLERVDRRDR